MRNTDKERLNNQTQKRYMWLRFKNGYKSLKHNKVKQYILIAINAVVTTIWLFYKSRLDFESIEYASPIIVELTKFVLPTILVVATGATIILYGTPIGSNSITNELSRIGLTNSAGETPFLITKTKNNKQTDVTIFEFDGVGIPLKEWENNGPWIEAALNIQIVKIKEGKNKRSILLYAVPAGNQLSSCIEWYDSYLVKDSSTLVLGKSLMGTVTVNLAKIPHILLGGSTGSGKSLLLKLLIMQAVKKNAIVYIADFKGGVDFPSIWHSKCKMCFDENTLIELLTELVDELQSRKILLRESECNNLDDYNNLTNQALPRYIFACDEVAELLDKTGLTKEHKDKVSMIESKLSIIARQGRAFGIHLILATQRPDANILSGQIRNNIDCRICGRADNVLSQIILDSTAAAEQIPKDAAGRFLLHDGTVFQAYLINENSL